MEADPFAPGPELSKVLQKVPRTCSCELKHSANSPLPFAFFEPSQTPDRQLQRLANCAAPEESAYDQEIPRATPGEPKLLRTGPLTRRSPTKPQL